jgi:hypothetical protein
MFNYKGYFDISLDGELVLGTRSFGLVPTCTSGSPSASGRWLATPGLTEYFFLVEFSAVPACAPSASPSPASTSAPAVTASGSGRVPLVVRASASVKILFVRISVSMSFTHRLHRAAEDGLSGRQSQR